MNTKIKKWGNSQGIRISRDILRILKWKIDDEVNIKIEENKLIIEKSNTFESDLSLKDLFAGYKDDYDFKEIDWGEPVSNEI